MLIHIEYPSGRVLHFFKPFITGAIGGIATKTDVFWLTNVSCKSGAIVRLRMYEALGFP